MEVFKFGGASVKNAHALKKVIHIVQKHPTKDLLIVVSAMGKMTNALEKVVDNYVLGDANLENSIHAVKEFHFEILAELFEHREHIIFQKITSLIEDLKVTMDRNKSIQYDFIYDQIICYGELISSCILSAYLLENGFKNKWVDARELIKTDACYRDATVDWKLTQNTIKKNISNMGMTVTQGFIAADANNFTTTLGREGSDYTAGIFAYCIDAESVTIWKDVAGVLSGDPKFFKDSVLLNHISYEEAIELAFYGASVIHPKTIQPLQRKEIPLYVRSFTNPEVSGTSVKKGQALDPPVPCYIVKKNQILISLSSLDFSFIVEDTISEIFKLFHEYQLKVSLIQNSAISFSVCIDDRFHNFEKSLPLLKAKFKVRYKKDVSLFTIRHFNSEAVLGLEKGLDILIKQATKKTIQLVARELY